VSPDEAAFFAVLRDLGGEWVSTKKFRDLLGGGYETFRPDRVKKHLKPPLADLVESKRPYGFRFSPDEVVA
jgi:hypothetical protein